MQRALANHLEADGWTLLSVADTETKEQGIDLLAKKPGRVLAVEVKGYPSTVYDYGPKKGQSKPTQPARPASGSPTPCFR